MRNLPRFGQIRRNSIIQFRTISEDGCATPLRSGAIFLFFRAAASVPYPSSLSLCPRSWPVACNRPCSPLARFALLAYVFQCSLCCPAFAASPPLLRSDPHPASVAPAIAPLAPPCLFRPAALLRRPAPSSLLRRPCCLPAARSAFPAANPFRSEILISRHNIRVASTSTSKNLMRVTCKIPLPSRSEFSTEKFHIRLFSYMEQ